MGIILIIIREGKEVVGIGADGFICLDKGVLIFSVSLNEMRLSYQLRVNSQRRLKENGVNYLTE